MLTMTYRSFIKKIFWLFIFAIFFTLLLFYRWYLIDFSINNLYQFIAASIFPISLMVRAFLWVFPSIYSKYEIYDNLLTRSFLGKRQEFSFNDIQEVRFSILPARFSGGYYLSFKNGRKLRIPSFLINSDTLIEKIHSYKSTLFLEGAVENFLKKYRNMGATWERSKSKLKSFPRFASHIIAIPLIIAYSSIYFHQFDGLHLDTSLIFIFNYTVSIIFLLLANSLEEYCIQKLSLEEKALPIIDWATNILYYIICFYYLFLTNSLPTIFLSK